MNITCKIKWGVSILGLDDVVIDEMNATNLKKHRESFSGEPNNRESIMSNNSTSLFVEVPGHIVQTIFKVPKIIKFFRYFLNAYLYLMKGKWRLKQCKSFTRQFSSFKCSVSIGRRFLSKWKYTKCRKSTHTSPFKTRQFKWF